MYAIVLSIVLTIYAMVVVDAGLLFKQLGVSADLITSAQAFYAAEGVLEGTLYDTYEPDRSTRNRRFSERTSSRWADSGPLFSHHLGVPVQLADRVMELNDAIAISIENDADELVSREPSSSFRFAIRQVPLDANFNQIQFDYGRADSEVLFEVFQFPRDGQVIDFSDFATLETNPSSTVGRMVINTKDPTSFKTYSLNGATLSASISATSIEYSHSLKVSGFNPAQFDYLISFQTLDNQPISYRFRADYNNNPVPIPSLNQSIHLTAVTSSGLYQSIQYQRRTEAALSDGLQFVHFSDQSIHK